MHPSLSSSAGLPSNLLETFTFLLLKFIPYDRVFARVLTGGIYPSK